MQKDALFGAVEAERERLYELADRIWETPELGLHEEESSAALADALADAGFDVERGIGGMPTAFRAEYGDGGPRIGLLGEFDALPSLSQAVSAERDPIEAGAPGHGCGHNLFGTAGVGAAIAVARAIDAGDADGTVVFLGCPAEETLVGKVFMARAGAFDDLDAALTWHPSDLSHPQLKSSNALDSVQYRFEGESAHAAAAPWAGRSALDAVELLNAGSEYMREHLSEESRLHYVITDGGEAPNVVPETAAVWYYVRAPTRREVERITDWLDDVAGAAATMTRTALDRRYVTGCYQFLPNETLTDLLMENMRAAGQIEYTDEDRAFAADLKETVAEDDVEATVGTAPEDRREAVREASLYAEPFEPTGAGETSAGSTEVGDVSWITPTAQFRAATWAVGTPAHTWQAVAANGSFGRKGMLFAAKVLAGATADLLSDPETVAAAREEFETATEGRAYETPLPGGTEPPFDVTAGD
ncbi:MAG: amidohydrolase [Haloarculaceae archaeon]